MIRYYDTNRGMEEMAQDEQRGRNTRWEALLSGKEPVSTDPILWLEWTLLDVWQVNSYIAFKTQTKNQLFFERGLA